MPMPVTNKKENLGQAYVHAIAAKAGFSMAKSDNDFGIDGTIKDIDNRNGRRHENGFCIEYQLKISSAVLFENGKVIYDLESKNYNDLAEWNGANPSILILFVMPPEEEQWIDFSVEGLLIRKCAWWFSLQGQPLTPNDSTKRIYIPENQVLSPENLEELMSKVRRGQSL